MTQITHYDIGDIWRPQATFTVGGTPTDPTAIVYYVQEPDGTITSASASSPGTLTSASTPLSRTTAGVFILSQTLDAAGHWYARFEGTGAATAAEDHEAIVDPTPFYDAGGVWSRALVGLGETKDWLGIKAVDTTKDLKIVKRINAASKRIHEVSGREFVAKTTNPDERSFDIQWTDAYGVKFIGDLSTLTSSSATITDLNTGTVVQTFTGTEYVAMPRNRGSDEPITSLRFLASATGYRAGNVLNITGTWGFPMVPTDVQHACMDTVAFWLDRDVEHFRQDLGAVPGSSEGGQTVILGSAPTILELPPEAYAIAKSYRMSVAA